MLYILAPIKENTTLVNIYRTAEIRTVVVVVVISFTLTSPFWGYAGYHK
jgi:hypothetical protein